MSTRDVYKRQLVARLEDVPLRQRRKRRVRFRLIPEGDGGDVILQRLVAVILVPAEVLNRHPQIGFEMNRIPDVPAVHPETLLGTVKAVRLDDLGEAGVGAGEDLVLVSLGVFEIVGAAKVILRSGPADGRDCLLYTSRCV